MTNNPTIDGVPRELLERLARPIRKRADESDRLDARKELRALLDAKPDPHVLGNRFYCPDIGPINLGPPEVAPAVERKEPFKWLVKCCYGPVSKSIEKADESLRDSIESARQYYGSEREIDATKASKLVYISPGEWFAIPLYRDQPGVAELQARIAELEGGTGEIAPFYVTVGDWNNLIRDDIGIAPVRVSKRKFGPFTEPLYTAPPAPVSVVLPDRADAYTGSHDAQRGWDSYGEKLIELNPWIDATAAMNVVRE